MVNNASTGNEDATRYGLYRKPTFAGLTYWVNQILGGSSFSTVINDFFQSASGSTSIPYSQGSLTDAQRILTQNKSFLSGQDTVFWETEVPQEHFAEYKWAQQHAHLQTELL